MDTAKTQPDKTNCPHGGDCKNCPLKKAEETIQALKQASKEPSSKP
jgi:hypothetical protein